MNKKKIKINELYALCNKEQMFNCGSIEQFQKTFDIAQNGVTQIELSYIIYVCSTYRLDFIYDKLTPLFNKEENKMYSKEDCCKSMYDGEETNVNKILIIKPEWLKDEYKHSDYQLFRATDGFGCCPDLRGNAVYGYFIKDGEEVRIEKYNFLGVANESIAKYAESIEIKPTTKELQNDNDIDNQVRAYFANRFEKIN